MDWSLIIFLVVVLYFAFRGYKKGLLKSLARILSVVAGYICAFLYTGQASRMVEAHFQLQGIAAFLLASLALFFGAGLLVSLLFWLVEKLLLEDEPVSTASSLGGAAVGSATGVLLAIVIVWCVAFVRDTRPAAAIEPATAANPSKIEKLANRVAGKAVASVMSLGSANPEVTKITAALAEAPADMVQRAQRLAQSDDMTEILNDPRNQAALNSGDAEAVRQLPAFQRLMNNADMQALASASGLLEDARQNNQAVDAAVATRLTDIWGRAQRAKSNQRVQEIIADAEFQEKIRSGNPLDLLTNDKLLELADIIFADEADPAVAPGQTSVNVEQDNQQPVKAKPDKKLYRWVDDSGRIYYSDVKPDS